MTGYRPGYARVSTLDQTPASQLDAPTGAGCDEVFIDHASGTTTDRRPIRLRGEHPLSDPRRQAAMFVTFCPVHGCDVLLGPGCIRNLANLPPGVLAVGLECYDGERLIILTGNQTSRPGS